MEHQIAGYKHTTYTGIERMSRKSVGIVFPLETTVSGSILYPYFGRES